MMTNLFSSFDPSSNWNFSFNWLSTLVGLFMIPAMFWFIPSRNSILMMKIMKSLFYEFKLILGVNHFGIPVIMISLLLFILFNNFLGLFPYIFTSSSHMVYSFSLALPLWLTLMLYGWINNSIFMFAHLVPQGTPNILMPFMVCIESISNVIRPGTLAVRLSANMIAGHLLMTLLGNTGNILAFYMITLLIVIQIMLMLLESAVAIIQSYVFSILMTLYSSEVI
uniref:ATP synthase F0 subunit 6 n=1 Tax=Cerogria janthinipennis TaxID=1304780 RepID=UPI002202512A|nr:ATP synthase F0 subunit 6 [Cerogria janthinipennis]UYB79034.1 ATP synthase F0 subunit 6 [Cerogria janthinipennis]